MPQTILQGQADSLLDTLGVRQYDKPADLNIQSGQGQQDSKYANKNLGQGRIVILGGLLVALGIAGYLIYSSFKNKA
jgi:type IV secretory pathway TrbF-like protein